MLEIKTNIVCWAQGNLFAEMLPISAGLACYSAFCLSKKKWVDTLITQGMAVKQGDGTPQPAMQ